jgi:DNA-directed RNA polymerase specialized sigma24 family protein
VRRGGEPGGVGAVLVLDSYEEAAAIMGCKVGTVKSRVSRARGRLAELLGYDGSIDAAGFVAPGPMTDTRTRWEYSTREGVRVRRPSASDEDQREALVLVGAEGVSYEEAAAIMGCKVGTVKRPGPGGSTLPGKGSGSGVLRHRRLDQAIGAEIFLVLDVEDLQSALAKLPPDQREALVLVGAEGVSYEEATREGVRVRRPSASPTGSGDRCRDLPRRSPGVPPGGRGRGDRLDVEDLQSALAKLPPDQREALVLVGAEGVSCGGRSRRCCAGW